MSIYEGARQGGGQAKGPNRMEGMSRGPNRLEGRDHGMKWYGTYRFKPFLYLTLAIFRLISLFSFLLLLPLPRPHLGKEAPG